MSLMAAITVTSEIDVDGRGVRAREDERPGSTRGLYVLSAEAVATYERRPVTLEHKVVIKSS